MPNSNGARTALIVVSHPTTESLSHSLVDHIRNKLSDSGIDVEIADLYAEGFSPAMTPADIAYYRQKGELPEEIVREQARIDRADMLFLVFPVYWWSVPALLKGWIDRVFTNGWAYDYSPETNKVVGKLTSLPVHLIATATSDEEGYTRHGYTQAFQTQIIEGTFHYCGMKDTRLTYLWEADSTSPQQFEQFVSELNAKLPIS